MGIAYPNISIADVKRVVYEKPVVTQTEVAQELGTTRFVVGYRIGNDMELRETLRLRSAEAKSAARCGKPLYIVRANGDEYCTLSLRELGRFMYAYRDVNDGILNVNIQRRRFSSLPKINSVVGLTCQKQHT